MCSSQLKAVEKAVKAIEMNIDKPFGLDELSREVGMSKYHLIRLFKAIANKSPMSYVRARRLSLSLSDLLNTNLNILDIALKYQFEYEQSYIRAFQSRFGITPAKYRKSRSEMPIEQKIDLHTLHDIGQGLVITPHMVLRPKFYIQGIQDEIFHQENYEKFTTNQVAMRFRNEYLHLVPNRINENVYLALILYSKQPDISNYYLPGVETTVLNPVKEPFHAYTIPSQEYAVFRYVGLHSPFELTYKTLYDLYQYIDSCWQLHTDFTLAQSYHFERLDLDICSENYCEMDIYYPIKR
jgi:AraC family transcriptional regulator